MPDALDHGARVLTDVRAVPHRSTTARARDVSRRLGARRPRAEILVERRGGRARGQRHRQRGARCSPARLPDPHARLGRGLSMHPGVAVAGWFDERIEGWKGIPQSYECTELLDFAPGSDHRVWITTAFAHPIGAAIMLPGFGARHRAWMLRYPHIAVLTAMLHDETEGSGRREPDGRAHIDYVLSYVGLGAAGSRRPRVRDACSSPPARRRCSFPACRPSSSTLRTEVERSRARVTRPHHIAMAAVHPMGTLCLGDDPRRAVVDEHRRASPARRAVRPRRIALSDEYRRSAPDPDLHRVALPLASRRRTRRALRRLREVRLGVFSVWRRQILITSPQR